jgi:hypothetical protein
VFKKQAKQLSFYQTHIPKMKFCFYTTFIIGIINILFVCASIAAISAEGLLYRTGDVYGIIMAFLPLITFGVGGVLLVICASIIKKKMNLDKQKEVNGFLS